VGRVTCETTCLCGRIVRNKFAEKVKHTLYGRRDAGDVRRQSSNNGDNIARLLAAATSAELALLKQSPDSTKRSRHFDGNLQAVMGLPCINFWVDRSRDLRRLSEVSAALILTSCDSTHVHVDALSSLSHTLTLFLSVDGRCLCLFPDESQSLVDLSQCFDTVGWVI